MIKEDNNDWWSSVIGPMLANTIVVAKERKITQEGTAYETNNLEYSNSKWKLV